MAEYKLSIFVYIHQLRIQTDQWEWSDLCQAAHFHHYRDFHPKIKRSREAKRFKAPEDAANNPECVREVEINTWNI